MRPQMTFLLANLALAFYNVGTIWAHEIDIFRTWKLLDPPGSPLWAIWGNVSCQLLSHVLTGMMWGRWQAALSVDPLGAQGPSLDKILRTHWIRTGLVSAYALILLAWSVGMAP
jgi:hypothetical protein